jgi:hypothetical protein
MDHEVISVAELRAWCTKTLDVVEHEGRSHFIIPRALYWKMDHSKLWDVPAAGPTVFDAQDDVTTLREEAVLPIEDLVAWHSLEHLSGVLAVIASQWDDSYPFARSELSADTGVA